MHSIVDEWVFVCKTSSSRYRCNTDATLLYNELFFRVTFFGCLDDKIVVQISCCKNLLMKQSMISTQVYIAVHGISGVGMVKKGFRINVPK